MTKLPEVKIFLLSHNLHVTLTFHGRVQDGSVVTGKMMSAKK